MKGIKELIEQSLESYPEKYSDFSGGVPIPDGEIKGFIRDGINNVKDKMINDQLKESHFSISTGNTIVFGEIYRQSNNKFTVCINVCKSYSSKSFIDIELK